MTQINQLALARRLRPRTFQAVVGQEVTLRALSNALETGRLHHAYLFTGTRGVGKTTLARIFAKCLNCEKGVSATPCGQCDTCLAIDEGRCVDLLEVDAASRTKVEDTRELLENVQYLPTRARFKIYLIDEVHMLSTSSFNALLKTLEEPPSHVKFLLATTDPQKLPLTVLSRCLQFHLHRLPFALIVNYLQKILGQESIPFETAALEDIARASEGSLRDALSLLEQAISYGHGNVTEIDVRKMLGLTEKTRLLALLQTLVDHDAAKMLAEIEGLAESSPDFSGILSELLALLRHIAIAQKVPEAVEESVEGREKILELSRQLEEEEVQLFFQIGVLGQKDLPYAPTARMGFEMVMLRMLAFQPYKIEVSTSVTETKRPVVSVENTAVESTVERGASVSVERIAVSKAPVPIPVMSVSQAPTPDAELNWSDLIPKLELSGIVKQLAEHCTLASYSEEWIQLVLEESQKPLLQKRHEDKLNQVLSQYFKRDVKLKINVGKIPQGIKTPASEYQQSQEATHQAARSLMETDPHLTDLVNTFNAKIEEIVVEKL